MSEEQEINHGKQPEKKGSVRSWTKEMIEKSISSRIMFIHRKELVQDQMNGSSSSSLNVFTR